MLSAGTSRPWFLASFVGPTIRSLPPKSVTTGMTTVAPAAARRRAFESAGASVPPPLPPRSTRQTARGEGRSFIDGRHAFGSLRRIRRHLAGTYRLSQIVEPAALIGGKIDRLQLSATASIRA